MKTIPKWLFIPPVLAALIVLGPLSMQSASSTAANEPDLWQMTGALVGVGLLGVVLLGVLLLGTGALPRLRQRGQTRTPGARLVTLRQTLRLSAQQAVHAIEFDNRILLFAENHRGLVLLETGSVQAGIDVAQVARHAAQPATASSAEEHDEGAVPKNLVLPRPQPMPRRRPSPSAAIVPARTGHALNDFRALLQKIGRP